MVWKHLCSLDVFANNAQAAQAARGRTWWLLLIPSALSGFLGVWQLQRLQWKTELLNERAAALQARSRLCPSAAGALGVCDLFEHTYLDLFKRWCWSTAGAAGVPASVHKMLR